MFCMFCLAELYSYFVFAYIYVCICKSKETRVWICKSRKIKGNHFVVL